MKRKIGLELIGPCSETGAMPEPTETVATINENGRVSLHKVDGMIKEVDGVFVVTMSDGWKYLSSECYLLYTTDAVSDVKRDIRRLRKNIRQKV